METKTQKHESFGLLSIARGSTSGMTLFGSSIKHREVITLEISTAEMNRNINSDYYSPRKLLISVDMSPTQFAEAITSLNISVGVPVTIRFADGKRMSSCPFENKVAQFNSEFADDMKKIGAKANQAVDMLNTLCSLPRVTKKQLDELRSIVTLLRQDIKDDLPYVNKLFTEQIDKTVAEAKGQVEAFITSAIHQTGLKVLRDKAPQLIVLENKSNEIFNEK